MGNCMIKTYFLPFAFTAPLKLTIPSAGRAPSSISGLPDHFAASPGMIVLVSRML